ncbi:hypothetical protein N2152v2_001395 [Parachlorella kessleri]
MYPPPPDAPSLSSRCRAARRCRRHSSGGTEFWGSVIITLCCPGTVAGWCSLVVVACAALPRRPKPPLPAGGAWVLPPPPSRFPRRSTSLPAPSTRPDPATAAAVVGAYRYHLPDAAQYTVGLLLAAMLDEPVMPEHDEHAVADQLLHLLAAPRSSAQCQAVLTLLSCISANTRARAALSHCSARTKLLQFGQTVGDARLRARALSLVKVLNKQELVLHT